MQQYLAQRIIDGKLTYTSVVTKRPDLKEQVDQALVQAGRQDLIVE